MNIKEINFEYIKEEEKQYIVVLESENEIAKINIEEDSIDEIKKVNDFILENVIEYDFEFVNTDEENENNINSIINSIIELYKKETNEIRDQLSEMALLNNEKVKV